MKRQHVVAAMAIGALCAAARAQVGVDADAEAHELASRPILADIIAPIPNGGIWNPSCPPGMKIIDGDIQVPMQFDPELDGFYTVAQWTNGVVPYTFDTAFATSESNQIVTAMNTWSVLANVSFVVRGTQTNYVYIQKSTVNNSGIGMQGGQQIINFAANQVQRVYIHELGHCLGLFHEHQRGDRGSYISVNQNNAQTAFWSANFPIINSGSYWGPYDFASIMHYDRCAFSTACSAGATCNCASTQETMTALQAYTSWNSIMGNATAQSYMDGIVMRGLYPFGLDRWADAVWFGSQQGTMVNPWNTSFAALVTIMPTGGYLYFKTSATYPAVGTWNKAMTIDAPGGPIILGN